MPELKPQAVRKCRAASYLQSRKMYHTVDIRMCLEDLVKVLLFPDIDLEELRLLARDELDAFDGLFGRVLEVVANHDLVIGLEQGKGGEGANVAGPTVHWSMKTHIAWFDESLPRHQD